MLTIIQLYIIKLTKHKSRNRHCCCLYRTISNYMENAWNAGLSQVRAQEPALLISHKTFLSLSKIIVSKSDIQIEFQLHLAFNYCSCRVGGTKMFDHIWNLLGAYSTRLTRDHFQVYLNITQGVLDPYKRWVIFLPNCQMLAFNQFCTFNKFLLVVSWRKFLIAVVIFGWGVWA